MRRLAPVLLAATGGLMLLAPLAAHATGIPYFDAIVPKAGQLCAENWNALLQTINNLIAFILTMAIVFFAPLMIAYAGFLYVTSPANPGNRSQANSILTSTVIGLIVALAGWIIVDAVMAVLYNAGASSGSTTLGTWSSIIRGDGSELCIPLESSFHQVTLGNGQTGLVTGVDENGGQLIKFSQGAACDATLIKQQDPQISTQQANQLACIAQGESSCGSPNKNLNFNWNKDSGNGKASTAAGPFQVLLSSNSSCYDNAICEQAANTPGQALNCKAAFNSKGFVVNQALADKCANAASNIGCSAAAAQCLLQTQSFQTAYAADTSYVNQCAAL